VLPLDAASLGLAGLGVASLGVASLGVASLGVASLGVASLGVASLGVASLGSINLVASPSRRPKDYAPSPPAPLHRRTPSPSHPFTVASQCRRPPNAADAAASIKSRIYQQTA